MMPVVKKQVSSTVKPKLKGGIADKIRSLGFNNDDGIKINLYGQSGTGKTTLWATFPKPILVLLCSGGKNPGELRSIDTEEYRKTIHQLQVEGSDEIREAVDMVHQTTEYATVVLDHATGLQDMVMKNILGLDELPPQSSWGMATQQQWGQCALQMKELLRAILSLETNVVIVAQERAFQLPSETESELLMPFVASALSPSVTGWLNPAVDYICQTFKRPKTRQVSVTIRGKEVQQTVKEKGIEYCLRTGPDEVYTTKFRLPKGHKLPDVIVDPSYDKIMKLIQGKA